MNDDSWLEPWLSLLRNVPVSGEILELGCDTGRDTKFLIERGFRVIATDISRTALDQAQLSAPSATFLEDDLKDSFPFSNGKFGVVLARLSLHYFTWQTTMKIVSEIHRCLTDGGLLICRLNSVNDANHGSIGFEEIEPNYYRANGMYSEMKRFFDVNSIDELFGDGWQIDTCKEKTIDRYERSKVVWELGLRKKNA
jgi:SAM-dependent methyltransferase